MWPRRQSSPVPPPCSRQRRTSRPARLPVVEVYLFPLRFGRRSLLRSLPRSPSQSSEPAVALVFPVAALAGLQNIGHADGVQILGLLISQLGRHLQTQRRAVLAIERLPVHLVTEQRLRMEGRSHVARLVVIIGALDFQKPRDAVSSDQPA